MLNFKRFIFLSLISSLFIFISSCDNLAGPEMSIEADPAEIPAGHNDYSSITVTLKEGGSPKSSAEIQFTTDNGSFSQSEELTESTVTTDSDGKAVVKLYSTQEQGMATVTARYETSGGTEVTKSVTVTFGPPQAGALPVNGKFNLDCDIVNVGALVSTSKPDIQVNCQITARNMKGNTIPPESMDIIYQAEAGDLVGGHDEYGEGFKLTYFVRGGNASPVDVDPLPGEPERACGGKVCNPRDGLVTLIAVTKGSESFQDRNGNGVWDDGEPFDDLAEPFLDANDNGQWDETEWFFDTDGNGEYSDGNGEYDEETMISASFKLVWTGKPEENETAAWITYSPQSTSLPNGASLTVTVNLVDKNLNPVAGFQSQGDTLNFVINDGLEATQPASSPGSYPISNISAIELDDQLQFLSFDENAAKYEVTFIDSDNSPDSDPISWVIGIDAYLSPGPEGSDGTYNQYTFSFNNQITGTIH